jgi:hypothetical protein
MVMNGLEQALKVIQDFLKTNNVPYMIIGGVGNLVWGEPRTTMDVDISIFLPENREPELIKAISSRFKMLTASPSKFVKKTRVLPIEVLDGVRSDLIFAQLDYEGQAIDRAVDVELSPGTTVRVCTAEDLIIHKAISKREKDWQDIEGVIIRRGRSLDRTYLMKWLKEFAAILERPEIVKRFDKLWKDSRTRGSK